MKVYQGYAASSGLVLGQVGRVERRTESFGTGPFNRTGTAAAGPGRQDGTGRAGLDG